MNGVADSRVMAGAPPVRQGVQLGLGTAPLGDLYSRLDEAVAQHTLQEAIALGVRHFDSAPLYGHGLAEHRLGTALRGLPRASFTLSTKVGRVMRPTQPDQAFSGYAGGLPHRCEFDYSHDGAWRSLEQSLLRLGVSQVDQLLIHDVDPWTHGEPGCEQRFAECMKGAYRALESMRAQGVVREIGIGVNDSVMCERFAREGDFDVMMLAGRYTLLEQGALHGFMAMAQARRIGVLLAGVFNSGILAQGAVAGANYNYRRAPDDVLARVARLQAVCATHGASLAAAAVQFAAAHPAVRAVVLGASAPQEIRACVAAASETIPAGLWRELRERGLVHADAPVPAAA